MQSLVKCLDHRGIASDTGCSHTRLCWAAQCACLQISNLSWWHGFSGLKSDALYVRGLEEHIIASVEICFTWSMP